MLTESACLAAVEAVFFTENVIGCGSLWERIAFLELGVGDTLMLVRLVESMLADLLHKGPLSHFLEACVNLSKRDLSGAFADAVSHFVAMRNATDMVLAVLGRLCCSLRVDAVCHREASLCRMRGAILTSVRATLAGADNCGTFAEGSASFLLFLDRLFNGALACFEESTSTAEGGQRDGNDNTNTHPTLSGTVAPETGHESVIPQSFWLAELCSGFSAGAVVETLHYFGLVLLPAARSIWLRSISRRMSAVASSVASQGDADADDQPSYQMLMPPLDAWRRRVACGFVFALCGAHANSVAFAACDRLADEMATAVCRNHLSSMFEILIDYPDSKLALDDMLLCRLRPRCAEVLTADIVRAARTALAGRLNHAGTQTEDIITVVVTAVRSLSIVFPSRDESVLVAACVSDTLAHLRLRRDVVACITKGLSDPNAEDGLAAAFASHSHDGVDARGQHLNIVRLLLSAIPPASIVKSYRESLADQLLSHAPNYQVDDDERVLERMKCILGEDALSECTVMIRDIHKSRRFNENVHARSGVVRRRDASPEELITLPSYALTMDILSHRKWPSFDADGVFPKKFTPHPQLASVFSDYADLFHHSKPDMRLRMVLSKGTISLTVDQQDTATGSIFSKQYTLDMLVGSVVLFLGDAEGGSIQISDLRRLLGVAEGELGILMRRLTPHHPRLLVVGATDVALQKHIVSDILVVEDCTPESNPAPEGISAEQLAVLVKLSKAMLKTAKNGKPLAAIYNSLRALGSFGGTLAELRSVLDYIVAQGALVRLGENYSLAK